MSEALRKLPAPDLTARETRSLLAFAADLARLRYDGCEQGDPPCGRLAAYEALCGEHLMCGRCREANFAPLAGGRSEKIACRRRDHANAKRPLSSAEVEALIVIERNTR